MQNNLPKPFKNAIIFKDDKLYACLANKPIAPGHVVVVWNKPVADINLLSRKDYTHLMTIVNDIRRAMIKTLKLKKIYLLYMDEVNHVHWHLVPRYNKLGIDNLSARPGKIKDFTLDDKIRKNLIISHKII